MNIAMSKHRRKLGASAGGKACSRLSVRGATYAWLSDSAPRFAQRSGYSAALFSAIFCLFVAASAFAQADFVKANEEFTRGHFKGAIAGYEALVGAGHWNANLFYDLGNAYFRTRDFGRAILKYERALALDNHHPETTANLQIARDEARALELQPTKLERYLQFASINQYAIAAAVAFWLGIFGIVALIFTRLGNGSEGRGLAIVTGNDVQARLATADTANSVLALPPGSEIKILSTRGDWMYAALPNDLRGWIQTKNAEQVRL